MSTIACAFPDRLTAMCVVLVLLVSGCQQRQPKIDPGTSGVHPKSKELIVRGRVDDEALKAIGARTNLEVLEIHQADCSADALTSCLKGLRHLKRLRVEGLTIPQPTLVAICELRELEFLNLPTADFNDSTLAAVARMPRLQLLRFGSRRVTDRGVAYLSAAPALRFLHLLNVPITDAGLESFHGMSQLESFYIDGGNETDDGVRALLEANPTIHFHQNQLHVADDPNADGH